MRRCSKKGTISYLSWLVPTWYCLSLGSPENSLRQEWRCDYALLGQPGSKGGQQCKWLQWLHWLHSMCQAGKRCAHLACRNFMRRSVKSNTHGRKIGQGVNLSFLSHLLFPIGQSSPWGISSPLHLWDWIISLYRSLLWRQIHRVARWIQIGRRARVHSGATSQPGCTRWAKGWAYHAKGRIVVSPRQQKHGDLGKMVWHRRWRWSQQLEAWEAVDIEEVWGSIWGLGLYSF